MRTQNNNRDKFFEQHNEVRNTSDFGRGNNSTTAFTISNVQELSEYAPKMMN
jgi:hypothetical protein